VRHLCYKTCGAPTALRTIGIWYPALTGWANLWRTYGAQISVISDRRAATCDREEGRKPAPLKSKGAVPTDHCVTLRPAARTKTQRLRSFAALRMRDFGLVRTGGASHGHPRAGPLHELETGAGSRMEWRQRVCAM